MSRTISSFPTIYHENKEWSIEVDEVSSTHYIIRTEHGRIGGALVIHEKAITEGKNIGRSNETTPKEQALREAQRDFDKKMKSGYAPTGSSSVSASSSKVQTGGVGSITIGPMLADRYEPSKTRLTFPVFIQPKLDGVRCLVYQNPITNTLVFQSRQNTPYTNPPHIERAVRHLRNSFADLVEDVDDVVLDGELYIHGREFREVSSIVGTLRPSKEQRIHPELSHLEYHIYDWFYLQSPNTMGYADRYEILQRAFNTAKPSNLLGVHLVETRRAMDATEITGLHQYFTSQRYEGVMIRNRDGVYKQDGKTNRSKDLLKMKDFFDEEYEIVGYHEGTGDWTGTPVWECRSKETGRVFSVTPNGPREDRQRMFQNVESYIGRLLTVKYQEKSSDGIPRFPIGVAIRDYE